MDKLLFQMHIMWYESAMVSEVLDSIHRAAAHSTLPIEYQVCLNAQTYIETPLVGTPEMMLERFQHHPILQQAQIATKTNADAFYNIGDWRREVYDTSAAYTIWGESDCLLPEDFFYIVSNIQIDGPHVLSFASRKMWDYTWDCVEHPYVQQFQRTPENVYPAPKPYNSDNVITQAELDSKNEESGDIQIRRLDRCKIDGSLLCLSGGLPTPFIAPDMHFVREDTCAEIFFNAKGIPQYHVANRMKGHNYRHPQKRTNTTATRTDASYVAFAQQSTAAMHHFLTQI
jgi:hypothetical protein